MCVGTWTQLYGIISIEARISSLPHGIYIFCLPVSVGERKPTFNLFVQTLSPPSLGGPHCRLFKGRSQPPGTLTLSVGSSAQVRAIAANRRHGSSSPKRGEIEINACRLRIKLSVSFFYLFYQVLLLVAIAAASLLHAGCAAKSGGGGSRDGPRGEGKESNRQKRCN